MSQRLGLRIKALRRLKRVTQQELAGMIEISVIAQPYREGPGKFLPAIAGENCPATDVPGEELFIIKERNDAPETTELPGRAAGS